MNDRSIRNCIEKLKEGDSQAVEKLWVECYQRLVKLARKRLEGVPRKMADEEDVALSALESFCRAARLGRFPDLNDQNDLWRILFAITTRKAIDFKRYESRRPVTAESGFINPNNEKAGIHNLPADPSEEAVAASLAEELDAQLGKLSPDLRELAVAKLEGYTNPEIAQRFRIALRTVERRLHLIRRKWENGL
ncbi:sigma-70 family RNA polymerase sigma factor [Thalassoglobus sp. JC818]|uniref:sigma-70 family RNA polymerase sigma factor n=1 Tax=Thalassoglobus sp. JC818 TaxID=3232136 RepID=UPI0034594F01